MWEHFNSSTGHLYYNLYNKKTSNEKDRLRFYRNLRNSGVVIPNLVWNAPLLAQIRNPAWTILHVS